MKLEVGEKYTNREGDIVTIVTMDNDLYYPFNAVRDRDQTRFSVTRYGSEYDTHETGLDLISHYSVPIEPEYKVATPAMGKVTEVSNALTMYQTLEKIDILIGNLPKVGDANTVLGYLKAKWEDLYP